MPTLQPYNRQAAVAYAHRWAFGRNPAYSNFDGMGGDCTNFASQCLYAGTGIMNFTPTYGWYYLSLNDRAPAWTGVEWTAPARRRWRRRFPTVSPETSPNSTSGQGSTDIRLLSWQWGIRRR